MPWLFQLTESLQKWLMGRALRQKFRWSTSGRQRSTEQDYIIDGTPKVEEVGPSVGKLRGFQGILRQPLYSLVLREELLGLGRGRTFLKNT